MITANNHEGANAAKDHATLTELACDLTVVEHRLRNLRRWTPEGARLHINTAMAAVAMALDSLHAEHQARTESAARPPVAEG